MKSFLLTMCAFVSLQMAAQKTITINLSSISPAVCEQMKASGDRISWYALDNPNKTSINTLVEVSNEGAKSSDKQYLAVKADPDDKGNYTLNFEGIVKLKKVDLSKPIIISAKIETIFGNEVFAKVVRDSASASTPIVLDTYMWRAGNEKIKPERKLCIAPSAFLQDATLRTKSIEEGKYDYTLADFQLFLKQEENAEWKAFTEPLQGSIKNGTALEMSNMMPKWIDPSKKLYVRFSVKTPKGNAIWGEYVLEPHEYRKEMRATHYTGIAFNAEAKLN